MGHPESYLGCEQKVITFDFHTTVTLYTGLSMLTHAYVICTHTHTHTHKWHTQSYTQTLIFGVHLCSLLLFWVAHKADFFCSPPHKFYGIKPSIVLCSIYKTMLLYCVGRKKKKDSGEKKIDWSDFTWTILKSYLFNFYKTKKKYWDAIVWISIYLLSYYYFEVYKKLFIIYHV